MERGKGLGSPDDDETWDKGRVGSGKGVCSGMLPDAKKNGGCQGRKKVVVAA